MGKWIFPAMVILLAGAALAEPAQPDVEVTVRVEREVVEIDQRGETVVHREPTESAGPGDVLVYTLRVRNVGASPALNARLEDPIPIGTVLVPQSVPTGKARVMASLDGGTRWSDFPVLVERLSEDGTLETVPAPGKAYTHLGWILGGTIDPGQTREVSFKVEVQ